MGCRCGDIDKYKSDISWLVTAEGYAQSLSGHAGEVRGKMDSLKGMYAGTVNAQDDFLGGFDKLDADAQANAGIVIVQLAGAKRTVEQWLRAAVAEDEEHHRREREEQERANRANRDWRLLQ